MSGIHWYFIHTERYEAVSSWTNIVVASNKDLIIEEPPLNVVLHRFILIIRQIWFKK